MAEAFGLIYVATKKITYLEEAALSARSVKAKTDLRPRFERPQTVQSQFLTDLLLSVTRPRPVVGVQALA